MDETPRARSPQPPYLAVRRFKTETELRIWHSGWARRAAESLDGFLSPLEGELSPALREQLLEDGRYLASVARGIIEVWDLEVTDLVGARDAEGVVEIRMTTARAWSAWRESVVSGEVAR